MRHVVGLKLSRPLDRDVFDKQVPLEFLKRPQGYLRKKTGNRTTPGSRVEGVL
jgi:hypothetical protein